MGFAEDFTDAAGRMLSDVSDMAKDLGNSSKLAIDKKRATMELEKLYMELGKKYYENNKTEDSDEIQAITRKIKEIKKINNQQILSKGGVECPSCKAVISKDAEFCPKCGTKLN